MLGLLAAMEEEISELLKEMPSPKRTRIGMRDYFEGTLFGKHAVLTFSRWGKVAAATTATELLSRFKVERMLFTGIAGGLAHHVHIGDLVVGRELVQHDMDARPLFERHEIPLLKKTRFETDVAMSEGLARAAAKHGKTHQGLIASGDRFFGHSDAAKELLSRLPDALCVEMEGAAVAQVCHEHGVPFAILRTISDSADENAVQDFPMFLKEIAAPLAHAVIGDWLQSE